MVQLLMLTFIRAIRGEKTIATLSSWRTAGNWKHSDFPDPVGIETYTSLSPLKKKKNGAQIKLKKKN